MLGINVQRYLQNHAQNCIFGLPHGGIRRNINVSILSENFNAISSTDFTRKTANSHF